MYISVRNSLILTLFSTLFIFSACNRKPRGKSIDYVSVSVLSRDELRALKKHPNADHLEAVLHSPLKEIIKSHRWFEENEKDVCSKNDLEEVADNAYYIVSVLTHSLPYLTEHTVDFLNTLGERMEATYKENGIIPYRFVLTSVLRTSEDQKKLRSFNYNATKNESAHFFGITFDISQTRFAMWDSRESVYTYRLRNLLARELIKLQDEGKCYVLLENREKCFHVTVLPD